MRHDRNAPIPAFDMTEAVRQFSKHQRPAQRRKRQKQLTKAVDGRSRRATGRTAQFNFKAKPSLKPSAQQAAQAAGVSLAVWMEAAVNAALANGLKWEDANNA